MILALMMLNTITAESLAWCNNFYLLKDKDRENILQLNYSIADLADPILRVGQT